MLFESLLSLLISRAAQSGEPESRLGPSPLNFRLSSLIGAWNGRPQAEFAGPTIELSQNQHNVRCMYIQYASEFFSNHRDRHSPNIRKALFKPCIA